MMQRSSSQHEPFPGTITSCNPFLCKLERLPPCQQQDCVSRLCVADRFHKDLHERCNTRCGFLGTCYQVSLHNLHATVKTLPGYRSSETLIAARHLAAIKVWLSPMKNPFFLLSIIKYRESECIQRSHHLHLLLKGFRKDKNIFLALT